MISLGIDCGTQSTKCIALDTETGQILASAQKAYGFVPGLPAGAMEQEPHWWSDAADETIQSVIAKLGDRKNEIRAIGVSGQQHGLVVLDENNEVIRPAKLWCDTSTEAQCAELTEKMGGVDSLIAQTGNPVLPGYTAGKILWLKQNEPANWEKVRSILLPHDYLNFWFTGTKRMEFGDASGTGLLNVRQRTWNSEIVAAIDPRLPDKLPELGSSNVNHGPVRESLWKKWGLAQAPLVSAGGGDNMIAAIGTGNVKPGVVTASLGTSGTLFAFSASPVVDAKGEIAAFCDSTDNWLPLLCTMNVTLVTELVRDLFAWDHAKFDELVRDVPAGSRGLLLLPYLTGERTPNLPRGCGVLHGLNPQNFNAAHLARAAMEGVTLGLGYGLQRLIELGIQPTEIRLTGGGSNSATWRQVCASVFGVPTVCLESGEGAALGAAVQGAWTWNYENGSNATLAEYAEAFVKLDESTRALPQPEETAIYREAIDKSSRLRGALTSASLI